MAGVQGRTTTSEHDRTGHRRSGLHTPRGSGILSLHDPHRVLRCTVAAILAAAAAASSPASRAGAQAPPSGDAVTVSFLAIGRDGRPVLDLKSDDVQLRAERPAATIKSLQRVDAGAAAPSEAAPPLLPPPCGSNASTGGAAHGGARSSSSSRTRRFGPGHERLAKQAIDQFLNTLAPSDRVALVTLPLPTVRTEATTASSSCGRRWRA